jgi:hypothetical protein
MVEITNILDKAEAEAYKRRSARSKFEQQISYGVGAAFVFGLISAVAHGLVGTLPAMAEWSLTMATLGPMAGLIGIGMVGIGCIFMSARLLSENTLLDQAMQAKQISAATRAHSPAPAVETPAPPSKFPLGVNENTEKASEAPGWAERVGPRAPREMVAAPEMDEANWREKLQASTAAASAAPILH